MIVYTAHEPVPSAFSPEERAEQVVFVREGFTWLGFLFPLPWLLFNRLWLPTLMALGFMALLALTAKEFSLPQASVGLLGLLLNFIVGFEGNNLKRWKLERRGYAFLATVVGRDFDEVESRFFRAWYPGIASGADPVLSRRIASENSQPRPGNWTTSPVVGTLPGANS